jgi:hypothetical protein
VSLLWWISDSTSHSSPGKPIYTGMSYTSIDLLASSMIRPFVTEGINVYGAIDKYNMPANSNHKGEVGLFVLHVIEN